LTAARARAVPSRVRSLVTSSSTERAVGQAAAKALLSKWRKLPLAIDEGDKVREVRTELGFAMADVNLNPVRRGFDALCKKGCKLVGDVAKLLGASENRVRRMEVEGVIPKARRVELARSKSVRAFTAKEVERIARSRARERWRAQHPGRWGLEHRTGQSISGFPFGEIEVWLVNPGRECVMSHSQAPGRPASQKKTRLVVDHSAGLRARRRRACRLPLR
jgi:hypothetical protein